MEKIDNSHIGEWLEDEPVNLMLLNSMRNNVRMHEHGTLSSRNREEFDKIYKMFKNYNTSYEGPDYMELELNNDWQWTFIFHKGVLKVGKTKPYYYLGNSKVKR